MAFSTSSTYACPDGDLVCFKRELGKKAEEALSLSRELSATNKLLDLEKEKSRLIQEAHDKLKETLPGLSHALELAKPKIWESPWLWLSIGVVLGAVVAVVSVAAAGQMLIGLNH